MGRGPGKRRCGACTADVDVACGPAARHRHRLGRSSRVSPRRRVYNDSEGREHVQLQFHMKGPSGRATVNAGARARAGRRLARQAALQMLLAAARGFERLAVLCVRALRRRARLGQTPTPMPTHGAHADMHKEGGDWRYTFLYLDVQAPVPQQVGAARGHGGTRLLRSAALLHPRTGAAGGQCHEDCRCPYSMPSLPAASPRKPTPHATTIAAGGAGAPGAD